MRRGEIHLVGFDPSVGSEVARRRPAVIVSNDGANAQAAIRGTGVLTVVPLTSNVTRVHPFQVLLPAESTGLSRDSKAQAEQVRSVSVDRVGAWVGTVPASLMEHVAAALRLHLAL